jgi:type III pantothenate kinase
MSVLVCSVGNTSALLGVFREGRLARRWRLDTRRLLGAKPPTVAGLAPAGRWGTAGAAATFCSVVPAANRNVRQLLRRATGAAPTQLRSRSPHGLRIAYREPARLGADRLAAALGAVASHPRSDLIVVDCGTATTLTAISRRRSILGGAILPGLGLWADALARRTAQLPRVAPRRPGSALGRSPEEAIASGTWFGHLGAIRELLTRLKREAFGRKSVIIIGTGGNAPLLAPERLFDIVEVDLVLRGLYSFETR